MRPVTLWHAAAFLAAFLAFDLELLLAKLLLPRFGGSAAVWTVSMTLYQALLLAAYAAAALLAGRRRGFTAYRAWTALAALLLPVRLPHLPAQAPEAALALSLLAGAGPLLLALFAATPLLQSASTGGYSLYAASNAGALAALLLHTFLLEPLLPSDLHLGLWSVLYVLFACALLRLRPLVPEAGAPSSPAPARERLLWLAASAGPCAALLASNGLLAHEFAAFPLLWALPLALYLATLVLNFKREPWRPAWLIPAFLAVFLLWLLLYAAAPSLRESLSGIGKVLLATAGLFMLGMVCHKALALAAPCEPGRMRSFYLHCALGGWAGSALIACLPLAARHNPSLALDWLLAAAVCLLALLLRDWESPRARMLAAATALCAAAALRTGSAGYAVRNFYGILSVEDSGGLRRLYHGTTHHGMQALEPALSRTPMSYYHPRSPLGDVYRLFGGSLRSVGAVGLGAGAVAAYGRPGQRLDFYEIDPDVLEVARTRFSYLRDGPADTTVYLGDARLSLSAHPEARYDLLILDAFSSGAVPVHLLTREAFELYSSRLSRGAVVAVHASSRHLDLTRPLAGAARALGLFAVHRRLIPPEDAPVGLVPSEWVVLCRDAAKTERLLAEPGWRRLGEGRPWTDRHASVLPLLRF
ncbi:MAG: fused MFS/spermidine synthase [Elusimicrobiota bacterium]